MKRVMSMSSLLISTVLNAQSLGVVGEVFPVAEKSLLVFIEEQANKESLHKDMTRQIESHIERPNALNLPRAKKSARHYYRPEFIVYQPMFGFKQGTLINAFAKLPDYQPHWIFFNADDEEELRWAANEVQHSPTAKVILTGGSIKATEDVFQQDIYFDQGGRITHQLGITHVPAKVTREGNALLVEEIPIKEHPDAA